MRQLNIDFLKHFSDKYVDTINLKEHTFSPNTIEMLLRADLVIGNFSTLSSLAKEKSAIVLNKDIASINHDDFEDLFAKLSTDQFKTRRSSRQLLRHIAETKHAYLDVLAPILKQSRQDYLSSLGFIQKSKICAQKLVRRFKPTK